MATLTRKSNVKCHMHACTSCTFPGPPSPPTNVTPSNQLYGCINVSILLQWDPPVDSGGTSVDNYTITVTGPNMQELTSNGTTATINVVYNELYTVNIRARNCAGSSGSATASIFEGTDRVASFPAFSPQRLSLAVQTLGSEGLGTRLLIEM